MAIWDWFTSPRERELRDLRELYSRVTACEADHPTKPGELVRQALAVRYTDVAHPEGLEDEIEKVFRKVLASEPILNPLEPMRPGMTLKETADLTNHLVLKEQFYLQQETLEEEIRNALEALLFYYGVALPKIVSPSPFVIPLYSAVIDARALIDKHLAHLGDGKLYNRGIFRKLTNRLWANVCNASGMPVQLPTEPPKKTPIFAHEAKLSVADAVKTFLEGTPFYDFFQTKIPLKLTHQDRYNHWHVLGGSGHGKTVLLENLIHYDLHSETPPSLVVIDPHGDLIKKVLRHQDSFHPEGGRFCDDLIYITPKDTKNPVALNIFDNLHILLRDYDEAAREQITAGAIQTFDYLFSGLLGADLTAKQGVLFKMVARLMLALPESLGRPATILDMMRLMEDPKPYQDAVAKLPPLQREFFQKDFGGKTFVQTKEQIRYRLQAIIENPTMARLFTTERSRINLSDKLNKGAIILIDTAKDFLKDASANYGKVMVALVLQAIMERAAIPEKDRHPTFLIIDEAADLFDDNIDDLLTEARKMKCGIVLAHQYMDQAKPGLKASLAANTGIKFAGGVSANDARLMAKDMRTEPDTVMDQPRLSFAAHIRGVTQQAVAIPVKFGVFDNAPQLTDEQLETLLEKNRRKISFGVQAENSQASQVSTTADPNADEDVSDKW